MEPINETGGQEQGKGQTGTGSDGNQHGRVFGSQNAAAEGGSEQPDISEVDQQEGQMNNGELGGNFGAGPSSAPPEEREPNDNG